MCRRTSGKDKADPFLKISALTDLDCFRLVRTSEDGSIATLVISDCLVDNTLVVEDAVDGKGLLVPSCRDGQEFPEACSPFEPSGRLMGQTQVVLCRS